MNHLNYCWVANIIINENYEKQRVSNYMIHIDSYIIISINTQVSYPLPWIPQVASVKKGEAIFIPTSPGGGSPGCVSSNGENGWTWHHLAITPWYIFTCWTLKMTIFFVETSLPTPTTARVYVNLLEGNYGTSFIKQY